jgi:hypothetical protein
MNYRDLQNISNLSQQILVEGANEEHNVLNRWPYTSPYLQENDSQVYDEEYKKLPVGKIIGKSNKFQNQYITGPTETDAEYKSTLDASRRRARTYLTTIVHDPEESQQKSAANKNRPESEKRSKTTSNEKKFGNRLTRSDKQGIKDSYDLYDIILSHLLDEGYAETQEQAEVIMVNMSEGWREDIMEITRKDATSQYAQSYRGEFEGADDEDDVERTNNLRRHIYKKFGKEAAEDADRHADSETFGRKDPRTGKRQPRPQPRIEKNRTYRTTKSGKMHGQDQSKLKRDLQYRRNERNND